MKKINTGIRTGGSKRKKDFKKKIKPWCRKHLRSGHPWDGTKVYMGGKGLEKKPLICDACGEKVYKIKGEFHEDKLIDRCEDCISLGIFKMVKDDSKS